MFETSKVSDDGQYFYIYPVINDEVGHEGALPLHIYGMGVNKCERHVKREEGYSYAQVIYCTEGDGTLIVEGQTYLIGEGMGFYIPAGVPHEYYPNDEDDWSTSWLVVDGSAVEDTFRGIGFSGPRVVKIGNLARIDKTFHDMYYCLSRDTYFGGMLAAAQVYSFILEFYRYSLDNGRHGYYDMDAPLTRVLNYIDTHYADTLTLEILCKNSGISPQHLCRLFRKKLNIRPMEYIAKKRIQEAKALLVNTPKSVADISTLVGYHNCNYFCITFKKVEGISPTEYRKSMV